MDPTRFFTWWRASPKGDDELAAETKELDPDYGICPRTVRRIRYGLRSDSRGIKLLMEATGLQFEDFLPIEWLAKLQREKKP